jgi:hypothetical protein
MATRDFYCSMVSGLNKVSLSGRGRAQAERQMRRAAVLVEMLLGSPKAAASELIEVSEPPVVAREPQKYRAAA